MSQKPLVPHKVNRGDDEEEEDDDNDDGSMLKKQFVAFVQYKNETDPGTHILLSQSDFWMKHAGVIKGRNLTQTDTGVCYFKFKKYKLSYKEYLEFLHILADYKNITIEEIIEKLVNCGPPPEGNVNVPTLPR